MKFRISEYQIPQPETENKFFVETGELYEKKIWWIFYEKKINWKLIEGFKTMEEALSAITEIKKTLPIYHEIK